MSGIVDEQRCKTRKSVAAKGGKSCYENAAATLKKGFSDDRGEANFGMVRKGKAKEQERGDNVADEERVACACNPQFKSK